MKCLPLLAACDLIFLYFDIGDFRAPSKGRVRKYSATLGLENIFVLELTVGFCFS